MFPALTPEDDEVICHDFPVSTIPIGDEILSLKADLKGTRFAIGTSGNDSKPLKIYDIEE